jgi:hypothetical protein
LAFSRYISFVMHLDINIYRCLAKDMYLKKLNNLRRKEYILK